MGYKEVIISERECIGCRACVISCPLGLIELDKGPKIDYSSCLECGKCEEVCKPGSIETREIGYKIFLGGKLGRQAKLARLYKKVNSLSSLEKELDFVVKGFKDCLNRGINFSDFY